MANLRFRNMDGSGPQGFKRVFKWAIVDKVLGRRGSGHPGSPAPTVKPDLALIATPPAPGRPARVTWLGHASWLIQLDGISLVIDPVLGKTITGIVRRFVPPGVPVEQLPPIASTLITHSHYDHLDSGTVRAIGVPVIAGIGMSKIIRRAGLPCKELNWWESALVGSVKVSFVPSQHWSKRGLTETNDTLWGGFIIEGSVSKLYHSGDTAYFDGFKEIGRRFPGLDAAFLPIGAYDPQWFMGSQHINPEEAVQAVLDLVARDFFAMHWGTFKLTDEPLDEPPKRLREEWKKRKLEASRLQILAVGQTAEISSKVSL